MCSTPALVFAKNEADKDEEISPWMEKVDRGGRSTYLVPKGAKVEEIKGGAVVVEPPSEYAARLFYELDKRQDDMEKEIKEIKSELEEIREQCALQQQNSDEKVP